MPRTTAGTRQLVRNFGTCLNFDGSTAFVDIGNNVSQQSSVFTYCAWILPTLTATNMCIIGNLKNAGTRSPELRINTTNALELLEENIASIGTSTGTISKNIWTHVAISYSGAGAYVFYINGVASGSGTNLRSLAFSNIYVGKQFSSEFFPGLIDEVKLYNVVLSAPQVSNIYYGINNNNTDTGLVGYYRFDEGSGTSATDSSGTQAAGTITAATYSSNVVMVPRSTAGTRNPVKSFGSCLSFVGDSTVGYAEVKSGIIVAGQTNCTILGWYNSSHVVPGVSGYPIYCERAASGNDIFKLVLDGSNDTGASKGAIGLVYRDDAGTINYVNTTINVPSSNAWHMVALTKSGTAITIWNDGAIVKTGVLTATNTLTNASMKCRIGGDAGDNLSNFAGLLDDIHVYNIALTNIQIQDYFNSGIEPPSANLQGYWKFDEGSGTSVTDSSGVNSAGTITAGTYSTSVSTQGARTTA